MAYVAYPKPRCRVPGCARSIFLPKMMCYEHWRAVPKPLRRVLFKHPSDVAWVDAIDAVVRAGM